ncbi:MAG: hypothetical protein IJK33_04375 [Clostridia bacterium]|nr:hypothetical protein [Clostridia bacterium]
MSLLSKLFGGDKNAEKEVKNLLNGLFGNAQTGQPTAAKPETPASAPSTQPVQSNAPAGIPAEENQYNYNGTYEQYFEHVFAEDFPAYRFEKSYIDDYGKHRVIYTFFSGAGKALVVELMTESSEAVKFRNDCIKAGVPYLRFYYDHEGWWNTRSYLVGRMRGVLNA